MTTSHPSLQSYARTIHGSFPLILVIGREPNTDLPIGGDHGLYDFDAAPRCAFWNVAFGLLGRSAALTVRGMKAEARSRKAAPIIFGDALPIGLKNEIVDKNRRRVVEPELINQHLYRIFGYRQLLDRVQLVLILSGAGA